jgi:glycosyltransferase involved in cell wall biosynthesis
LPNGGTEFRRFISGWLYVRAEPTDRSAPESAAEILAAPERGARDTSRPLRVLHIIHGLAMGGMERLLVELVRRADRSRVEMHILALDFAGPLAAQLPKHVSLHLGRHLPRWSMLWPGPLIDQVRSIAPDVVHTHGRIWLKAARAARIAGVPRIVHTEHGRQYPDPWISRMTDRLAARYTDAIVGVSTMLQDHLTSRVVGRGHRVHVIANGIDTSSYRPRPDEGVVRRELGIPQDAPIIGTVGRFAPVKGHSVMIEAFARLRSQWKDGTPPVLVIVGEGIPSERVELQRQIDALGIAKAVYMPGLRDDVSQFHAAFTIFTLASFSEGTSISLLEAMSAGVCPVVTDVGGNRAVLGPQLAHRLVPSGDPAALAAAWARALSKADERATDRMTARDRITTSFSLDTMLASYTALYASTSHGQRPRVVAARTILQQPGSTR